MGYLFTLFGLVIAVSVFLYVIYAADTGKRKLDELRLSVNMPRQAASGAGAKAGTAAAPDQQQIKQVITRSKANQLDDKLKDLLPRRICPLCQSELRRDEPLYAHNMEYSGKRTILIYGCPYCYKDEKKRKA